MAYRDNDEWVFEKKEIDRIFEKAINKKLNRGGILKEREIYEIGRELDIDQDSLRSAVLDIKRSIDIDDLLASSSERSSSRSGPGGTAGGLKAFIIGSIMTISGGYMLTNQVQVRTSGFWSHRYGLFGGFGVTPFGATLVPFLIGIALLFYNGKSKPGWFLTGGSLLAILVGIITNLELYFQPTSLYVTLIMLVLFIGGIALVARSLREWQ